MMIVMNLIKDQVAKRTKAEVLVKSPKRFLMNGLNDLEETIFDRQKKHKLSLLCLSPKKDLNRNRNHAFGR